MGETFTIQQEDPGTVTNKTSTNSYTNDDALSRSDEALKLSNLSYETQSRSSSSSQLSTSFSSSDFLLSQDSLSSSVSNSFVSESELGFEGCNSLFYSKRKNFLEERSTLTCFYDEDVVNVPDDTQFTASNGGDESPRKKIKVDSISAPAHDSGLSSDSFPTINACAIEEEVNSSGNENNEPKVLIVKEKEDKKMKLRKWLKEKAFKWGRGKSKKSEVSSAKSVSSKSSGEKQCQNSDGNSQDGGSSEVSGNDSILDQDGSSANSSTSDTRPPRLRPRSYKHFLLTKEPRTRAYLKKRSHTLGRWFVTHFTHPYPSKEQKDKLASATNMSKEQVSEWFGNMRRRIRIVTRGLSLCWEQKVQRYNSLITGKSEPLPILPEDLINSWNPNPTWRLYSTGSPASTSQPNQSFNATDASFKKYKKNLLERYLNDYTECPTLHETQIARGPISTASTKAHLTQQSEENRKEKPKNSLPIARINPWSISRSGNKANTSVTKTLKIHLNEKKKPEPSCLKTTSKTVEVLTKSFSVTPSPKTYSNLHKPKPHHLFRGYAPSDIKLSNLASPSNSKDSRKEVVSGTLPVSQPPFTTLTTFSLPSFHQNYPTPIYIQNPQYDSNKQAVKIINPYYRQFLGPPPIPLRTTTTYYRNDPFEEKTIPLSANFPFIGLTAPTFPFALSGGVLPEAKESEVLQTVGSDFVPTRAGPVQDEQLHSTDEMSAAYTLMEMKKM